MPHSGSAVAHQTFSVSAPESPGHTPSMCLSHTSSVSYIVCSSTRACLFVEPDTGSEARALSVSPWEACINLCQSCRVLIGQDQACLCSPIQALQRTLYESARRPVTTLTLLRMLRARAA